LAGSAKKILTGYFRPSRGVLNMDMVMPYTPKKATKLNHYYALKAHIDVTLANHSLQYPYIFTITYLHQ